MQMLLKALDLAPATRRPELNSMPIFLQSVHKARTGTRVFDENFSGTVMPDHPDHCFTHLDKVYSAAQNIDDVMPPLH
jgi:hypothetical protein